MRCNEKSSLCRSLKKHYKFLEEMVIISAYNGHRFCRGQLWLWHDPICGNKREGVSIPSEFERCVRYTRQVLVVQNMYTLSDRSVLVIPFSGHEHTTLYNIVCISDEGNTSYALPQLMFPADVNQLIKYIGVVDDAIMNSVDSVIQSILLPTGKPEGRKKESSIQSETFQISRY